MKYCNHCGHGLPRGSSFCPSCGRQLRKGTDQVEKRPQKTDIKYAGFKIRAAAYIVDLFFGSFLVGSVTGFVLGFLLGGSQAVADVANLLGSTLFFWLYDALAVSIWSTTIGKGIFGLRVVNVNYKKPKFGQALLRSFSRFLSILFIFQGYWKMGKRFGYQANHDKQAKTYVIRR